MCAYVRCLDAPACLPTLPAPGAGSLGPQAQPWRRRPQLQAGGCLRVCGQVGGEWVSRTLVSRERRCRCHCPLCRSRSSSSWEHSNSPPPRGTTAPPPRGQSIVLVPGNSAQGLPFCPHLQQSAAFRAPSACRTTHHPVGGKGKGAGSANQGTAEHQPFRASATLPACCVRCACHSIPSLSSDSCCPACRMSQAWVLLPNAFAGAAPQSSSPASQMR